MKIRKYVEKDAFDCLKLFTETVHSVNAFDYNKKQLDAVAKIVGEIL